MKNKRNNRNQLESLSQKAWAKKTRPSGEWKVKAVRWLTEVTDWTQVGKLYRAGTNKGGEDNHKLTV